MKKLLLLLFVSITNISVYSQIGFGLTIGANMTNEITAFNGTAIGKSNDVASLKGLVIGPTIEMMAPVYDFGLEVSTFYSQKGSNFSYYIDNYPAYSLLLEGYRSIDYMEVPVCLKWRFGPRDFKAFVTAGYFWGFALKGTVSVESTEDLLNSNIAVPELEKSAVMKFGDEFSKYNFLDQGYTFGAGIDILRTIQLGIYYSVSTTSMTNKHAMEDLLLEPSYAYSDGEFLNDTKHSTVSVRLTYIISGQR